MDICSVPEIVRAHGTGRPDHPALVQGETTISWSGLYERAGRVANYLASVGVGPQDRIALLDKNSLEHFEIFFGAGLLNAVTVSVNWRLAAPEVEYIVNDASAKVFIVGQEFLPVLHAIADRLPTASTIVVIGGADGFVDFRSSVDAFPSDDPGIKASPDDIAFQLYSSGTTGRP
ncbi:MAG: AMP-binding protein, partial [Ilumatobacteraceae bacterium]